jgi:hypothetical protein
MGLLSCDGAIGMTLRVGAAVSSKSSFSELCYCLGLALLFDRPHT